MGSTWLVAFFLHGLDIYIGKGIKNGAGGYRVWETALGVTKRYQAMA